jgi:TIR domain
MPDAEEIVELRDAYQYDVCLSFAGEDRDYVEKVARELRAHGVRVFYDRYEVAELWGKDLYEHLTYVYSNAARYCVLFVSRHYAEKVWTNHERRSAQERAMTEHHEYILPARFDDTEVPGLRSTVGFVDLQVLTPEELVELIEQKLGPRQRIAFIPPELDRLHAALGAESVEERDRVDEHAGAFFGVLLRMTPDEREVAHSPAETRLPGRDARQHPYEPRSSKTRARPASQRDRGVTQRDRFTWL